MMKLTGSKQNQRRILAAARYAFWKRSRNLQACFDNQQWRVHFEDKLSGAVLELFVVNNELGLGKTGLDFESKCCQ